MAHRPVSKRSCFRNLAEVVEIILSITHTINLVLAGLSETNSSIYYPTCRHRKIKKQHSFAGHRKGQ